MPTCPVSADEGKLVAARPTLAGLSGPQFSPKATKNHPCELFQGSPYPDLVQDESLIKTSRWKRKLKSPPPESGKEKEVIPFFSNRSRGETELSEPDDPS